MHIATCLLSLHISHINFSVSSSVLTYSRKYFPVSLTDFVLRKNWKFFTEMIVVYVQIAPVSSDLLRIRGARSNAEPLADDYTGRSPPDELAEPFTVCLTTSVANPRPETVAECDIGLHRIDSTDFVDIPVPADSVIHETLFFDATKSVNSRPAFREPHVLSWTFYKVETNRMLGKLGLRLVFDYMLLLQKHNSQFAQ